MKSIKTTLKLFLVLVLVSTFSFAQTSTLTFKNAESAEALVKKYVTALQNDDVATMNAQLSKDVMVYGLGGGIDSLNYKQHADHFRESTSNYKHKIVRDLYLPVKVTDNWNEGEWVLTWGTNMVTNRKTGTPIRIPYHIAILVADGKISQMYFFYDMLNILETQKYTVTPPKG